MTRMTRYLATAKTQLMRFLDYLGYGTLDLYPASHISLSCGTCRSTVMRPVKELPAIYGQAAKIEVACDNIRKHCPEGGSRCDLLFIDLIDRSAV